MLWRLNFLVILLCMAMGNTYILYYICPLHTFYFFVVYAIMSPARWVWLGLRLFTACILWRGAPSMFFFFSSFFLPDKISACPSLRIIPAFSFGLLSA